MKNENPYIQQGSVVAVIGFGVTGRSAVRYVLACGGQPIVSDSRGVAEFAEMATELEDLGIEWEAGGHNVEFLQRADLVLLSPGVSLQEPVVSLLRKKRIPIYGELALLAPVLEKSGAKVVAVTGSNGKTTVTSLIGEVLRKAGRKVFIGGNIGVPLYEFFLNNEKTAEIIVAEVSSFQLECAGQFAPDIAILLNISSDHLDRHGDMVKYTAVKMALFSAQNAGQVAIVNENIACCQNDKTVFHGQRLLFGCNRGANAIIEDDCLILSDGKEQKKLSLPFGTVGFAAENFAAAALALRLLGIAADTLEGFFAEFIRPPHRLEEVADIDGVLYINDSKATNTGAVLGALRQQNRSVLLIAGGRGKGEDYSLLCEQVRAKVRSLVLIGEAAAEIAEALKKCTRIVYASSLETAVTIASGLAVRGDVVLLSPACTSYDMFSDYAQRGECFRKAVALLQEAKRKG